MSNSVDILIAGKETVGPAANSAISGLQKLNDQLHGTQGKLKEFNTIMELAFGFHVGRFFFEKIHEGIVKIGEGFAEAKAEGMDFAQSMNEGVKAALGLSTALQNLEAQKKRIASGETQAVTGFLPGSLGSNTTRQQRIEALTKSRESLSGALADAQKAAVPQGGFWANYADLILGTGFAKGDYESEKRIPNIKRRLEVVNDELNKLRGEADRDKATSSPEAWTIRHGINRFAGIVGGFGRGIPHDLFNVEAAGAAARTAPFSLMRFLRQQQITADENFRDSHLTPGEQAKRQLDELKNRGALLTPEERKQAGYGILATLYSAAGLNENSTIGSVAAQNARFLTRGTGPQQSPELNELQQMKKDIQDMAKRLLPDLTKAVKQFIAGIGVAGA